MQKKKVMVVDDDSVFREELNEMLHLCGYEVMHFSDTSFFIENAYSEKPDIIIMNVKMAGENDFQLAENFKNLPQTREIPIIGISAYLDKQKYPIQRLDCSIKALLAKPFNPIDIISKIENLLPDY